ncbi:MAG TPA: phospholipase D-like domain-containing protein [Myxococcaceae bacterium]|nr:phospholipase D-like domain-containing protein [Myxococcaceae bacterium]
MRARALPAVLLLFLLGGCRGDADRSPLKLAGDIPPPGPGYRNAFYQLLGTPFVEGNATRWVWNGEIFDALVEEIGRARTSVDVVLYIWRPGKACDRIIDALAARGPEVACRIVVDPVGSTPAFQREVMPRLQQARCEVHVFRPLGDNAVGPSLARNHRKIVVFDGRVAFTGGFGIADDWLGDGVHDGSWRDTAVRVEGPGTRQLQLSFSQHWLESQGTLLPAAEVTRAQAPAGEVRTAFVSSSASVGATPADRMTQLTFLSARSRLWISNAYFTPSDEIVAELESRARAGVDVRLLVPGPVHDQPAMRDGQRSLYRRLLAAGVKIWEYQPSMMHAKTVLADHRLAIVGSMNLDPLSLNLLEEGSLAIDDPQAAAELAAAFERDTRISKRIEEGAKEIPGFWGTLVREAFRQVGKAPGR